jgi:nitroimidazol reductase NimA-like FMN-containing flavoprotein (pyridoxamine 5'-phosphate oxidase superfamily)
MNANTLKSPEGNLTEVRRKDRQVQDETWIREFLHKAAIGVLATVSNEQPFINSNLFVYDEGSNVIYMHTARQGRTRSNVEGDRRVCFSVFEMGRVLPADTALEFSVEYGGVVVFGTASVVEDRVEGKRALQMLLDKYARHLKPGTDYRPTTDEELDRTSVYRITIEQWSGKKKEAAKDFPGAFRYGEV